MESTQYYWSREEVIKIIEQMVADTKKEIATVPDDLVLSVEAGRIKGLEFSIKLLKK